MTAALVFALVLPSVVMYGIVLRVWDRAGAAVCRPLAAAIAPAFGLGVASALYFLLLMTASRTTALRLDALLWLGAGLGLALDWKRRGQGTLKAASHATSAGREWKPALVVAGLGCVVLVAAAVAAVWLRGHVIPHGESDGIAIWNLRARSIERTAPDWSVVLSPAIGWSQPDYPLLIPLTVARLWAYTGNESLAIPQFVAMLFFLSSVATVGISVGRLRGRTAGLLSGMAVVAARTYVFQTSCQCADVPIAFFILGAISFAVLAIEAVNPAPFLVTAGASAGLAAWTKNEGQLLVILVGLFVLMAFPARRLRAVWLSALGAALPLATVAVFKFYLSPASGLIALQTREMIADKIVDHARWTIVLSQMWTMLPQWGAVPGGALAGVGLAVALAVNPERLSVRRAAFGVLLVAAMLSGYTVAYVITPWPLQWHIATSFERLIVQLWPATVWAAFQLTGAPLGSAPGLGDDADVS